ncbi:nitrate- and nitrite sensing domain-containing protein [Micromonospora echinofusca]|uniref:histidine kinase n=1 Tax=Micromonospora echinofusca TaxID=47858 RepID=A0ABS3VRC0_MICEH|nr:nitrate- and nitrite sensing domain-containing protein [Micromonospora echinofusca]MBO4207062.1 HAMP domain-containing protein [Micromonospora echinofusca]
MGSRSASLRTKVVALLVSLAALWAFAAWVTLRDGLNLLWVQSLDSRIAQPSEPLLAELQSERRLSVAYLAKPAPQRRAELQAQVPRTEALSVKFRESVRDWRVDLAATDELSLRIRDTLARLDRLPEIRRSVQEGSVDRAGAARAYTDVLDSIFRMYGALSKVDDEQIAKDTSALIQLVRVRELMSQQDALLTGSLVAGRMTGEEYARFARLIGAQRFLAGEAIAELPMAERARYEQMVAGEAFTRFRALEDRIIRDARVDAALPVSLAEWRAAIDPSLDAQQELILTGGDALVDRVVPVAAGVIVRMVLAAGLGLITVIASIVVSISTARALLRELDRLRGAAWRLANERLPGVVERLGRGEEVDVATEAPPLEFGDDEIGQVGKAFNAVQETAIRTAVEQAELRRNVRDVFLSLARRTQALVHRQLTLLDAMERRENDAEELEDLFRVDHLATRMRRNAENLIVLSGSTPGRAWRRNVPMVDVVRGAVAEVEDYTRVNVLPLGPVALAGRAVGDVIHLLAELIENGLSFSPPHTTVEVRGQMVANGFVIEIEDRGLGMSEEDLAAANARIVDHSELNLANATRLGLYVVSRLTERHGVRVQLRESPYGGTTAVVLIPSALVTDTGPDVESSGGFPVTASPAPEAPRPSAFVPVRSAAPGGGSGAAGPTPSAGASLTEPDQLPTRSRTIPPVPRAAPTTEDDSLPVRPRRLVENPALDGPTFPTGLPVTVPRPAPAAAAPADPESAASGTPVPGLPQRSTSDVKTESGLPVRVRQANLAPELRDEGQPDGAAEETDTPRPPEQVRRMMSSYQSGTRRGRTEAARLLDAESEPEPATDSGDNPNHGNEQPG